MKNFIENKIIRNFKKIPYFFEITHNKPSIEQYNYALFGKLSSSILHDILTPLTSLSLGLEINKSKGLLILEPIVEDSTKQIKEYIEIMRCFLNKPETDSKIHINKEIIKCIKLLSHRATKNNTQIQFIEFDQIYTKIYPLHIYQIVINLLSNAIEASINSETKKIILILRKNKNNFIIECKDFGIGISKETYDKIFLFNFSTKSKERGFGLYSIQYIIQELLNGKIIAESEPNKGSLFSCTLPIIK